MEIDDFVGLEKKVKRLYNQTNVAVEQAREAMKIAAGFRVKFAESENKLNELRMEVELLKASVFVPTSDDDSISEESDEDVIVVSTPKTRKGKKETPPPAPKKKSPKKNLGGQRRRSVRQPKFDKSPTKNAKNPQHENDNDGDDSGDFVIDDCEEIDDDEEYITDELDGVEGDLGLSDDVYEYNEEDDDPYAHEPQRDSFNHRPPQRSESPILIESDDDDDTSDEFDIPESILNKHLDPSVLGLSKSDQRKIVGFQMASQLSNTTTTSSSSLPSDSTRASQRSIVNAHGVRIQANRVYRVKMEDGGVQCMFICDVDVSTGECDALWMYPINEIPDEDYYVKDEPSRECWIHKTKWLFSNHIVGDGEEPPQVDEFVEEIRVKFSSANAYRSVGPFGKPEVEVGYMYCRFTGVEGAGECGYCVRLPEIPSKDNDFLVDRYSPPSSSLRESSTDRIADDEGVDEEDEDARQDTDEMFKQHSFVDDSNSSNRTSVRLELDSFAVAQLTARKDIRAIVPNIFLNAEQGKYDFVTAQDKSIELGREILSGRMTDDQKAKVETYWRVLEADPHEKKQFPFGTRCDVCNQQISSGYTIPCGDGEWDMGSTCGGRVLNFLEFLYKCHEIFQTIRRVFTRNGKVPVKRQQEQYSERMVNAYVTALRQDRYALSRKISSDYFASLERPDIEEEEEAWMRAWEEGEQ